MKRGGQGAKRNVVAMNTVRCPTCGVGIGQPCKPIVKPDDPSRISRATLLSYSRGLDIHWERRALFRDVEDRKPDDRSEMRTSPVVGGTIHIVAVDKPAAVVTSPGPQEWPSKELEERFVVPGRLRNVPPDMPNLTGLKVGRLTVVGLSARLGVTPVWMCRCSCGYYVRRRTKALRNATSDACRLCSKVRITVSQ